MWSVCLSCLCRSLCLAKGIRVILWFFLWLCNSQLTAEIIQGQIRNSRHKIWFSVRPPRSHSLPSLSAFLISAKSPSSSFPSFLSVELRRKTLVTGTFTFCLWWLRCKTQVGLWVTHVVTHDTSTAHDDRTFHETSYPIIRTVVFLVAGSFFPLVLRLYCHC